MEQKTISRNELLLTQDFHESFNDGSYGSDVLLVVDSGDGESCSLRLYDDRLDEVGEHVYFILNKEDAERFAQAILIHSGAWKVS
jgi:hypothetical protein